MTPKRLRQQRQFTQVLAATKRNSYRGKYIPLKQLL